MESKGESLGEGEAVPAWLDERHAGMFRCKVLPYVLLPCVSSLVPVVRGDLAG